MECPNCQTELPSQECRECSKKIPQFGGFCCYCGAAIASTDAITSADNGEQPDNEPDDFSSRVLCSDGTCIGIINDQGVCNECGKPLTGEAK